MRLRLLFVWALSWAACSTSSSTTDMIVIYGDMKGATGTCPTNGTPSATVVVVDDQYMPKVVTVPVCGKVRWNFQASAVHGVFPWDMGFPSSPIMSQGTYEYVFPIAGTFDYGCAIHGRMMPGQVVVR